MRKLFAALLLLAVATTATADQTTVSIKAKPGQTCAYFRGDFSPENIVALQPTYRPWVACTLTENVGAVCWLKGHGMGTLPDPAKFVGNFGWRAGKFVVEVGAIANNVFNLRVLCDGTSSAECDLMHFWNREVGIGYGCDMAPYSPPAPAKPAPQPPPLLRKPDASNAPPSKPKTQQEIGI